MMSGTRVSGGGGDTMALLAGLLLTGMLVSRLCHVSEQPIR